MTIPEDVKQILLQSKVTETTVTLPGTLERPMYMKVDKILKAIGVTWNKKMQCHVANPAINLKNEFDFAFATGSVVNAKQANQEFFTPPELVERVVDQVASNHSFPHYRSTYILEPSAGQGALAKGMRDRPGHKCQFVLVEQQRALADQLKAEWLGGAGNPQDNNVVLEMDFLKLTPKIFIGFDVVIMNPPFSGGQDMDHIEHAYKFLRTGGHLVAITSPSWHTGKSKRQRAFQDFVEDRLFSGTESMQHFEAGAFKQSGTNVATMMIHLWKRPEETT